MTYRFRIALMLALLTGLCLTLEVPAAGRRQKLDAFPRMTGSKMHAGRWLGGLRLQAKGKPVDMNMVSLEVAAFRTLRTLRATRTQCDELLKLFKEDFVKDSRRQEAKTTPKFRKALIGLRNMFRTAGMEGDEDDDFRSAMDRIDLLFDDDEQLDDGVDVTPAASDAARVALRLFTPQQIFALLRSSEDEITDPSTILVEALSDGLTAKPEDWKSIREDAASQAAWMISGRILKTPSKVRVEIGKWLDAKHAAKMKPPEFEKQRAALRAEADEKFKASPTAVLGNIAWHRMAELLCNPRLPAALKARIKSK
jgi:hypothetical protein